MQVLAVVVDREMNVTMRARRPEEYTSKVAAAAAAGVNGSSIKSPGMSTDNDIIDKDVFRQLLLNYLSER